MQKSRTQGEGIQEYTKNMDEFLNKLDEYLSDNELTRKEFGGILESDILRYEKKLFNLLRTIKDRFIPL